MESRDLLITNKVRLCERSEPQSEPFVGQARLYIEKSFLGRGVGKENQASGNCQARKI